MNTFNPNAHKGNNFKFWEHNMVEIANDFSVCAFPDFYQDGVNAFPVMRIIGNPLNDHKLKVEISGGHIVFEETEFSDDGDTIKEIYAKPTSKGSLKVSYGESDYHEISWTDLIEGERWIMAKGEGLLKVSNGKAQEIVTPERIERHLEYRALIELLNQESLTEEQRLELINRMMGNLLMCEEGN